VRLVSSSISSASGCVWRMAIPYFTPATTHFICGSVLLAFHFTNPLISFQEALPDPSRWNGRDLRDKTA